MINDTEYLLTTRLLLGELPVGTAFTFHGVPPMRDGFISTAAHFPPQGETCVVCTLPADCHVPNGEIAVFIPSANAVRHFHCQCAVIPKY